MSAQWKIVAFLACFMVQIAIGCSSDSDPDPEDSSSENDVAPTEDSGVADSGAADTSPGEDASVDADSGTEPVDEECPLPSEIFSGGACTYTGGDCADECDFCAPHCSVYTCTGGTWEETGSNYNPPSDECD